MKGRIGGDRATENRDGGIALYHEIGGIPQAQELFEDWHYRELKRIHKQFVQSKSRKERYEWEN